MSRSARILCRFDWLDDTVDRLWDGAGPCIDDDGEVWIGCGALIGPDAVDQAINGEAYTMEVALSGVDSETADFAWLHHSENVIVGSLFRMLIQACAANDQPVGAPETRFTGTIKNIKFRDTASEAGETSTLIVEVANRFTTRRIPSGEVLSDTNQRARSAVLNPGADPDLICGRVWTLLEKTIRWPNWAN